MRNFVVLLFTTVLICTLIPLKAFTAAEPNLLPQSKMTQSSSQTSTLSGTIVKIDMTNGIVVIKDQNGKLWEFNVSPQAGIDLSRYKVGDTVTATVASAPSSGDKVTRARISKTQLIKLQ
jgi:hypothetical protein